MTLTLAALLVTLASAYGLLQLGIFCVEEIMSAEVRAPLQHSLLVLTLIIALTLFVALPALAWVVAITGKVSP